MRAFFVMFLLAWLTGIALGVVGVSVAVVLMVIAAVGLGTAQSPEKLRLGTARQAAQLAVAGMLLVCLGWVWGGYSSASRVSECSFNSPVIGEVVGQPQIRSNRVLVVVHDERNCQVLVTVGRFSDLGEGDLVKLTGGQVQSLNEVRGYSEGYAGYLQRRGISATWRYSDISVIRPGDFWVQSLRTKVRERVTSLFIEPDASVVMAVLLAEKGTLPEGLVDQFRTTGVSHVLAISGLHISLLTGMLLGALILLPLLPPVRAVIIIVWLWSYVMFIGMPTSAVRAATFWTIGLLAWQLHVLVSLPTVLLAAATVMVSLDPLFLLDVGFQLSISAVLGIFLVLFLARGWRRSKLVDLGLVSFGAWVATGPVIAYHFGNIVLSGVVTNLAVVPLVPALLVLAILALLLSLVFMPAAALVAWLMHGLIAWVDFATGFISSVPGLFYEVVVVSFKVAFLYYLVVLAICVAIVRYQKRNWREIWQ